jgi:hypothetical protein
MRGGDQRLEQPSLLARSEYYLPCRIYWGLESVGHTHSMHCMWYTGMVDRVLVKDPSHSVTAISPPEVARHVRIMVRVSCQHNPITL